MRFPNRKPSNRYLLNCKKGQGRLQLGTGYTAFGDTLNCNWGRSKIEFHYVPEWGLPFEFLFKISFQIFDLNSLLLHRITVTYGYSPVFF